MISRVSTVFGFLALIFPFVSADHRSRHHQEVARRARGNVNIYKRQHYYGARFTYYDTGLGACGVYNQPTDWIVALTTEQYGDGYPGPYCFRSITISYNGKQAVATIMDECMACPYGGLDFSSGLFEYFDQLSAGVLYGEWWFNDNGGQTTSTWTPPTTTWEQPTTTPDYTPTSSTADYTPPTTPSTPAYTPSPTASTTSSTSSTPSSVHPSSSLASGLAVATAGAAPTPSTTNPQNLYVIHKVLVEFGIFLSAVLEDK